MDYDAIVTQALTLLQREQRLSYRVLKLRLQLDDDTLEALKEDLIYTKKLAVDEDGRVLVWTSETGTTAPAAAAPTEPPARAPLTYTPPYTYCIPTVCPSVASRNLLLYQSLPSSVPSRYALVRRRKDDTGVGTASKGIVEGLRRFPRRVPSHGGPSGRVRCALSTGPGDQGQPAQRAPLPPGAAVPFATQECRGHRNAGRCRALGPASGHRHYPPGSAPLVRG